MICPVCKSRWASFPYEDFEFIAPHGKIKMFFSRITFNFIKRNGWYPKHEEAGFNRGIAYGSNEVMCCENMDCVQVAHAMIIKNCAKENFKTPYNDLVQETKKELAEGKFK